MSDDDFTLAVAKQVIFTLQGDLKEAREATKIWATICHDAWAERDMLARQLAEANRYIRDRIEMDSEDDGTYDRSIAPRAYNDSRVHAAISWMQDNKHAR